MSSSHAGLRAGIPGNESDVRPRSGGPNASHVPEAAPRAWFEERTYHHDEFDPDETAAQLAHASTRVSVVIPTLDEAETVAGVVEGAVEAAAAGLVDEIVVVDGGSADGTVAAAAAAGARVLFPSDVLAGVGPAVGKGDALWRGLAATDGEIVVFLDADVHDPGPHFVAGLVGPLMANPSLVFAKACYERTHGRVTELVARPLLSSFWPHLAGFAQPLAGEYAGRRAALAEVPFATGYGVELGLLVDLAERFGVDRLAQVDLGVRTHAQQSLRALGRMAMEVLHAATVRLTAAGRLSADMTNVLYQVARATDGALDLEGHPVRTEELPPLSGVLEDRPTP